MKDAIYFKLNEPWGRMILEPGRTRIFEPIPGQQPKHYGAPACRCGSRATKRVGYLARECSMCRETFHYRLHDGIFVPMAAETAKAWDER